MRKRSVIIPVLCLVLLSGCGMSVEKADMEQVESEEPELEESSEATDEPEELEPEVDSAESETTDFYAVATSFSAKEVETFAKEVREMILNSDWEGLSKVISYPITVGDVTYEDAAAFAVEEHSNLQTEEYRAAVEAEDCHEMFCNYQGIMFGNGEVWLSEILDENLVSQGLKVVGLNVTTNE